MAVADMQRANAKKKKKPDNHQDNQKTITEINKKPCDKDNPYAMYNVNALFQVMPILQGNAFKLWAYLGKNNSKVWKNKELSSKDAMQWIGCSRSSYDDAVKTLIDMGFLVKVPDDKNPVANKWKFNELPWDIELESAWHTYPDMMDDIPEEALYADWEAATKSFAEESKQGLAEKVSKPC